MANTIKPGTKVLYIQTDETTGWKVRVVSGVLERYISTGTICGSGYTQHQSGGYNAVVRIGEVQAWMPTAAIMKDTPENRKKMESRAETMTANRRSLYFNKGLIDEDGNPIEQKPKYLSDYFKK